MLRSIGVRHRFLLLLLIFFLWCGERCDALNPIEIRGYKFFDTVTEEEFRIRGIDYYPRPNTGNLNQNSVDFFTEKHRRIWERDLPYLQELGVNAIRIYAINSRFNHDAFFCALERAGIYVIVELVRDCPTCAITSDESPTCYPVQLKRQGQDVIRKMSKYSNLLGFSAGNEVNHYAPPGRPQSNAPCQKKFLRDMRHYADTCSNTMRHVPIGLVAADSDREANALYYNCQSDPNDPFESAEWFGLNSYVSCDGKAQTYEEALGFNTLQENFASYNYSIPVVLTEFGCVSETFPTIDGYEGQRDFKQALWMHTVPSVQDQFVGGFAFEYSMEMENAKSESPFPFYKFGHADYGIGYFGPDDCNDVDVSCAYHPLPNFENLREQYVALRDNNATNNSTTLADFEVLNYRTGRSVCPSDFPGLNEFVWAADRMKDLACPSRRQPMTFVCPANLDDLRPGLLSTIFSDRPYLWAVIVVMALLVMAAGLLLVFACMTRVRDAGQTEDYKLPWETIMVTTPKFHRSEGDTASSESMGLLSLSDLPKGDYHAIESDASSEAN